MLISNIPNLNTFKANSPTILRFVINFVRQLMSGQVPSPNVSPAFINFKHLTLLVFYNQNVQTIKFNWMLLKALAFTPTGNIVYHGPNAGSSTNQTLGAHNTSFAQPLHSNMGMSPRQQNMTPPPTEIDEMYDSESRIKEAKKKLIMNEKAKIIDGMLADAENGIVPSTSPSNVVIGQPRHQYNQYGHNAMYPGGQMGQYPLHPEVGTPSPRGQYPPSPRGQYPLHLEVSTPLHLEVVPLVYSKDRWTPT